ncbi:cell division cycle 5-like protein isoform X5 [Ipomoea triloba]|uniref:cell division cycle 5-like protein isoform X1 n=2 Tax=Ipomoea triloba TaxID=35885 RepID=UPI00125DD959|nr:cell division cycle 5-like protein isoform X1 [Ipomoea triloba]XP_031105241.1 cell division cycle 5-like protein isoform X2 [Ipomoea triloba]XP_031105243.1 cell division cycle 5-like protein isoform X3 [Ipomoea triloba]XP_031105244.1 cell division cycle 5-like protein isoform X1 [Ipomoea triloba]XP_031105246.1 cell division cycle 5-like protein isoform X5 [Ipomoea triloba]
MRIMIKGGVWKNTEDEILKAAVMKYGKNQWARISSLLVRKSAKQCKARWYEWLDPSIKKTEWTREEDEKLLHLAKLMPTQWRTIAPIVGRTPSQCLERYEKLLDAACAKDENYEAGDDPRKLRPGEIDPNPESKPARPDPVDMDEDEKEMLSEARARLANTRGKKAKRKAREKQLEEARRLASLQKRRELKAAGIDVRHRKRKRKGIDYNAEIPFEKKPPPGFYDVTDEDRTVEQPKFPTTIEELEGERRVDKEARLRKQDIARNKIAQRQDAPSAILHANKLNDPETVRKRTKLNLPAPQISDHELEAIAKFGIASDLIGSEELLEGNAATRALVANYTQTPRQGMTPLRTPQRTPANKQDAIMMEAENQRRLSQSQTPLLGGENPMLHPSDFSGVTPKKEIQTPNPLLTPSATPGGTGLTPRIGMTPSSDGYSFGMTPKGTPMRDELHINEEMDMDGGKVACSDSKRELRSRLGGLPNPKNEYQIVMQPLPEESEEPEEKIEEDMSERIAREKAEEEARQLALLRKRSKALQRDLPRPPAASLDLIKSSLIRADEDKSSFVPPTLIEQADELIRRELLSLLEHDNVKYPIDEKSEKEKKKGTKRKSVSVPVIEDFEEDELKEAEDLIKDEAQFLRVAMGHETESLDEFVEAHKTCSSDIMYFPTRNAYGLSSVAGNMEKLSALQFEFENVKKKMDDDTKKAQKLEQKVKVLTNGYQFRAGKIWSQIEATFKQMDTAGTELECFKVLQKQEQLAASNRINNIWEEVQKQKDLERTLQKRYGDLLVEKERIEHLMDEYKKQAQMQEIEAKNRALELTTAEGDAADNKMIVAPSNEDLESVAYVNEHYPAQESPNKQAEDGSSMAVDPAQESPNKQTEHEGSMADDPAQENPNEPTDNAQEQPSGSPKLGMDIDEVGSTTDTNELSQSTPAARESSLTDEVHAENACNESESGVTSGSPKLMNADENPTSGIGGEASADAFVSPITEDQVF